MKHRSTIQNILLLREAYPESSAQTIASVLELTPEYVRLLLSSNGLLPLGIRGFPRGPEPKHWAQRTKDIIALRQANELLTLKEIGDRVGVTHERVRQILKRAGLPTRATHIYKYLCTGCHKVMKNTSNNGLCRPCLMATSRQGMPATLPCNTCGKSVVITLERWRRRRNYLKLGFPGNVYCNVACRNKANFLLKSWGWRRYLIHCKRGHPLSGDNLLTAPSLLAQGKRRCRACVQMRSKAFYLKRKAARRAALFTVSPKP